MRCGDNETIDATIQAILRSKKEFILVNLKNHECHDFYNFGLTSKCNLGAGTIKQFSFVKFNSSTPDELKTIAARGQNQKKPFVFDQDAAISYFGENKYFDKAVAITSESRLAREYLELMSRTCYIPSSTITRTTKALFSQTIRSTGNFTGMNDVVEKLATLIPQVVQRVVYSQTCIVENKDKVIISTVQKNGYIPMTIHGYGAIAADYGYFPPPSVAGIEIKFGKRTPESMRMAYLKNQSTKVETTNDAHHYLYYDNAATPNNMHCVSISIRQFVRILKRCGPNLKTSERLALAENDYALIDEMIRNPDSYNQDKVNAAIDLVFPNQYSSVSGDVSFRNASSFLVGILAKNRILVRIRDELKNENEHSNPICYAQLLENRLFSSRLGMHSTY